METIVEGSEHTGDGMGHGMDMSDHLMSPYLFGNLKPFFLLFREAKITTGGHLAAAIVVTIVFTMVVTLFSFYAKYLEKKASESAKRFSLVQISATFAFATRMFFHYIVMLLTSKLKSNIAEYRKKSDTVLK